MLSLSDSRLAKVVSDLESQLDLPPAIFTKLLSAKRLPVPERGEARSSRLSRPVKPMPEIPEWAKNISCPRCSSLMTAIKAKSDTQWGAAITLQCHGAYQGTMCLLVTEVSTSSPFKMMPDDFVIGDIGWKSVAIDSSLIVGKLEKVDPYPYKSTPPSPWVRQTVKSVVFDQFWRIYLSNKKVSIVELQNVLIKDFPKYTLQSVVDLIKTLPTWMCEMTGFVVSLKNGELFISGRGKGNLALAPFSSSKYRQDFGF